MATIREFQPTDADYQGVVNVQNAIYLDMPAVIEDYKEHDEHVGPKCVFKRWLALEGDQIVADAQLIQYVWAYHPHKFNFYVRVMPAFRCRGIGTALYDTVMADAEQYDPIELRTGTRSNFPDAIRFLEKRSFAEHMRHTESHLDLAAADLSPWDGLEDKLRDEGIVLKSIRELRANGAPDWEHRLYEAMWIMLQDIPGSEDLTQPPFDTWRKENLETETLLPDAYLVALDGDDIVGLTQLWADRASDMLYTGFTGVKRDYRRRGIATALKARAIRFGKQNNNSIIKTDNEEHNPMLGLNIRLGFVEQPAFVEYRKTLREE
ncbi:MAG: GNAT family N-acetyltransferase [Chloroflexi bacterium]|nr:GNAT family N-acetyltransferase [Chloroflexota bacterium]